MNFLEDRKIRNECKLIVFIDEYSIERIRNLKFIGVRILCKCSLFFRCFLKHLYLIHLTFINSSFYKF